MNRSTTSMMRAGDDAAGAGSVPLGCGAFGVPALRKLREGRGTHRVAGVSEIKSSAG
jgi:hypothetical protein